MWWLPGVSRDACTLHLPAADRAAARLLDVLLALPENVQQRAYEAIAACPGLAIWCLVRAGEAQAAISTQAGLGRWLVRELPQLAAWQPSPAEACAGGVVRAEEATLRFAGLAARGLGAVARFDVLSCGFSPDDADAGRLLALIHVAPAWLHAAGLGAEGRWQDWLPASLSERLAGLHAAQDDVAAAVRASIDTDCPPTPQLDAGSCVATVGRQHPDCHGASAEALARAWLESDPTAVRLLPQVAAQARRLAELDVRLRRLVEEEKLAALAEFAAGAGHEINNPLAVISGRAQLALRGETNPERRRELALIHAQALRIHEMIADLMLFARPPQPVMAVRRLADLLDQVRREVEAIASVRGVTLAVHSPLDVALCTDAAQLCVALRAVVENALRAVPQFGRVEVTAEVVQAIESDPRAMTTGPDGIEAEEGVGPFTVEAALAAGNGTGRLGRGRWLAIKVADNGPGLPPEVRRHAFDPFYSGRAAGRGLGMGLAKCWRIVRQLGGKVSIAARTGGGTLVTLWLPADAGK